MNIYPGSPVVLTFHVYDATQSPVVLADPASALISVRGPCGTASTYTLSDCTRLSTGIYTLLYRTSLTDTLGVWWWDFIAYDSGGLKLGVGAGTFPIIRDGAQVCSGT